VARDASKHQYPPDYAALVCLAPAALEQTTYSPGNYGGGAIMFEVPRTLKHLYIDYRNDDGTVVATWQLY
jgi:hypothetical protein